MRKTLITTALLCLTATAAQAQGYVGLSGGVTHLKSDCTGTSACDNNGTGFKLYGGYTFMPGLAGEAVYFDFGKATASLNLPGGVLSADNKTSGFGAGFAAIGNLAPNVPAAARLGVAQIKSKVSGRFSGTSVSDSDSSTQAYFGLEVGYAFSKAAAITLSADFSRSEFEDSAGSVRMIGIGFKLNF